MGPRRSNSRRPEGPRRRSGGPGRSQRLALDSARRVGGAGARGRSDAAGKPEGGVRPSAAPGGSRGVPSPSIPGRAPSELVIGRHPVLEALRAGRRLNRVMVAETAHGPAPEEIVRLAAERNVPIHKVTRERLDALSDHHQGLVGDAVPYAYADFDEILASIATAPPERPPLIVAVDSLQDPQNLGTLLRTALAAGASAAILPERRAVGITPAVGRASAGAIEHLKISRVVNLVRALQALKERGLWIVGLDGSGRTPYDQAELTLPL